MELPKTREELETKAAIILEMLAAERELCGQPGRETYPLANLYEIADSLATLPAALPQTIELNREDWQKERDTSNTLRPRQRVKVAAGLAVQAAHFARSLETEELLNLDRDATGSLAEAIAGLEAAAFDVLLEFGSVLRQHGEMIDVAVVHAEAAA